VRVVEQFIRVIDASMTHNRPRSSHAAAIGFLMSGSAANSSTRNPSGKCMCRIDSSGGSGLAILLKFSPCVPTSGQPRNWDISESRIDVFERRQIVVQPSRGPADAVLDER